MGFIDRDELVTGGIYEVRSRNLAVGVYDGSEGFTGIREKFGREYLFTEYLARERGGTQIGVDTVHPVKLLAMLPADIPTVEQLDTLCASCGTAARWTGPPAPAPWTCEGDCEKPAPQAQMNQPLFDELRKHDPQ